MKLADKDHLFESEANVSIDHVALRRLWAAALHRGVVDYCDYRLGVVDYCDYRLGVVDYCDYRLEEVQEVKRRDYHIDIDTIRRTKEWFWSDLDKPGSFVWLCEFLGYDPQRRRAQIEANWRSNTSKAMERYYAKQAKLQRRVRKVRKQDDCGAQPAEQGA